ncbi:MAG: hypothetical protein AVDCRST_MAG25-747, partial [uncultured Rubrobacteraceae bacterium]
GAVPASRTEGVLGEERDERSVRPAVDGRDPGRPVLRALRPGVRGVRGDRRVDGPCLGARSGPAQRIHAGRAVEEAAPRARRARPAPGRAATELEAL